MGPAMPRSRLGPRARARLTSTARSLHAGAVFSPNNACWGQGVCRIQPRPLLVSHLQLTSPQQGDPPARCLQISSCLFPPFWPSNLSVTNSPPAWLHPAVLSLLLSSVLSPLQIPPLATH